MLLLCPLGFLFATLSVFLCVGEENYNRAANRIQYVLWNCTCGNHSGRGAGAAEAPVAAA